MPHCGTARRNITPRTRQLHRPVSRKEVPVPASKRVAVVGVGTMGSQVAWRLAARGAEVVGYDRFAPGHDRSAAGGETRIFRSAHFEDSRYVPLLKHADSLWDELQR